MKSDPSNSPENSSASNSESSSKTAPSAIRPWIGGVGSSLGSNAISVWGLRLAFLALTPFYGIGALIYWILWIRLSQKHVATDSARRLSGGALFREVDWQTLFITTLVVFMGYWYTLAPNLTLEDSGELAVASYYAGVPHPPGYPVWTVYTWLFTALVPFSNIAWRVGLSSAVAAALACGVLGMIVSRGGSMMIEGIAERFREMKRDDEWRKLDPAFENKICLIAGFAAGALLGFNGFLWSQAVIVEVYGLSVLSFVMVLASLLRWMYSPEKHRYLYWMAFWFGICLNNHQTLVLATMGLEVAIALRNPRLGRNLLACNTVVFLFGLIAKWQGWMTSFDDNQILFGIYLGVGVLSAVGFVALLLKTETLFDEWKPVFGMGALGAFSIALYFYMPITSMTNPPMNWGYPRTVEGFFHALSRGQYAKTTPTESLSKFASQISIYFDGAMDEFNLPLLLIALIPFLFLFRMAKREKAWLLGLTATFLCLSFLLIVLLNVSTDQRSVQLNRVFFSASHVIISMCIGYGFILLTVLARSYYESIRSPLLIFSGVIAATALFALRRLESQFPLDFYNAVFGLALALAPVVAFGISRTKAPLTLLLSIYALTPIYSVLSHWSDNEQRGHLFGYWFGHDMFEPPYDIYPSMAKDAILFGGTDPGRFCPTYMIFCESFTPASQKLDPEFDRSDVYIITQNALADGTYLDYLRAHYNRSAQIAPPFFQELVNPTPVPAAPTAEGEEPPKEPGKVSQWIRGALATAVTPLDTLFTDFGAKVEKARRDRGVYPEKEIYIPTQEDLGYAYQEYYKDFNRRAASGKLSDGEKQSLVVDPETQQILQVSGPIAVMGINAVLSRIIFEANPSHEFYVEESYPLEWMYPHLEPFGTILKLNREPLEGITDEMIEKDRAFWKAYSERLVGDWIDVNTSVPDVCKFVKRVYKERNYQGFKGDPAFVRDSVAQQSFSKLRCAVAGVYEYWMRKATTPQQQQKMIQEASLAYLQAYAFSPASGETLYDFVNLLASLGFIGDAKLLVETSKEFDQFNPQLDQILIRLDAMAGAQKQNMQTREDFSSRFENFRTNPADYSVGVELALLATQLGNGTAALELVTTLETQFGDKLPGSLRKTMDLATVYLNLGRTNQTIRILDHLLQNPESDTSTILSVADALNQLKDFGRLERSLVRLTELLPRSPEAWYDLAVVRSGLGQQELALEALETALYFNTKRLQEDPQANNLQNLALTEPNFNSIKSKPEFQKLFLPSEMRESPEEELEVESLLK